MPQINSSKTKASNHIHQDTSYIGSVFGGTVQFPQSPLNNATETQLDFFEQYKRVLEISYQIKKQLINTNLLKEQLLQKIDELQKNMENNSSIESSVQLERKESMKKRSRRMADEIQRKHKCSVEFCQKQYGSQGSLIQHIKLKHPEMYYSSA